MKRSVPSLSARTSGLRRRSLLGWVSAAWLAGHGAATAAPGTATRKSAAPPVVIQVWKSPDCGCCQLWVEHLQSHGFEIRVRGDSTAAVRKALGIPDALASCHSASVAGYAVSGHVPASDVLRLLKDRPPARGLAVPGMPIGSPGMDGPEYGAQKDPYDVVLFEPDGKHRVFQRHA